MDEHQALELDRRNSREASAREYALRNAVDWCKHNPNDDLAATFHKYLKLLTITADES